MKWRRGTISWRRGGLVLLVGGFLQVVLTTLSLWANAPLFVLWFASMAMWLKLLFWASEPDETP
jgi:hypothetical protein